MARIGSDVSQAKWAVAWLRDPATHQVKTRVFSNSKAGMESLLAWLLKQTQAPIEALPIMVEATGIYREALATMAFGAGAKVSIRRERHRLAKAPIRGAAEAGSTSIQTLLATLQGERRRPAREIDLHIFVVLWRGRR